MEGVWNTKRLIHQRFLRWPLAPLPDVWWTRQIDQSCVRQQSQQQHLQLLPAECTHNQSDCFAYVQDRLLKPLGGYVGYSGEWRELAQVISRVSSLLDIQVSLSWTICQRVCTHSISVRPQKFFRLEQNLYVVRGWWQHMTVCRMTRSNIKVEVMEIWNVRKWPISKAISSANNMHAIKRLMVNYDTPRQYLNFNWTDFWYSSSFSITWPSNLGCSTFGKRILPLTRSRPSTGSRVQDLFFSVSMLIHQFFLYCCYSSKMWMHTAWSWTVMHLNSVGWNYQGMSVKIFLV